MTGRRPKPTAIRRAEGNPGKRAWNPAEPVPPGELPSCPRHLTATAKAEWKRLAESLWRMGVLTVVDRAALAAYCACYGRWVEAERKLRETPALIRTPSGHVQQSPWLSVANRQLELMGRFMVELGLTPSARSRVTALGAATTPEPIDRIEFVVVHTGEDGQRIERPIDGSRPARACVEPGPDHPPLRARTGPVAPQIAPARIDFPTLVPRPERT